MNRRRDGWTARIRRRLYARGALVTMSVMYGLLALSVPWTSGIHAGPAFQFLFGAAALSAAGTVWKPKAAWLRSTSAATAVTAPAARALTVLMLESTLTPAGQVTAVVIWTMTAWMAFLLWPYILPPHIEPGRYADGMA